ncbi:hypothetical protein P153DRAFT_381353 [Dothidotthia symphoricarpi CBS 119687]|uniref:Uncharacterized protein n=1 Tax=Dothidotthia symphoricarpi CBS 119687 TaxID=1392245 RepID=A0A6A6AUF9_9PLEO|nr:uncharacterized protein P153DRAFT_381353 [Dothidotthia symphoricarpi CBS 119687]KAF2134171.1 hypothetical protein P153DRAFT_381353 [Dothidotthia symphoricarpi CBS 119687]
MASIPVQVSLQQNPVYLGVWTNWSSGSLTGLTLTVTLQNGGLLIAFLALFVTFTGTCFWTIVSFAVHQIQSQQTPQNAIYHQRQAILRNSGTSAEALWRLLRMSWTWRRYAPTTSIRRSLLPLAMSILTLSVFAIAGIFSSRVATSRDGDVLVVGNKCATVNSSRFTTQDFGLIQTYLTSRIRSSANYAATCYTNTSSTQSCRAFVRHSLPYEVTKRAACPFPGNDRICRSAKGAIRLDSGFIDSHFDLGINSRLSGRFLYRTVNECAPVQSKGYARVNSSSSPSIVEFLYGPDRNTCQNECTFDYVAERSKNPQGNNDYTLSISTHYAESDDINSAVFNTWNPIPELLLPHADISIIFLAANEIPFFAPVDDPWFAAGHQGPVNISIASRDIQVYGSDEPARALACTQQYQFCNPALEGDDGCTPLLGIYEATTASPALFPHPTDRERFSWSASAILNMAGGFTELIRTLRSGSLLARDSLSGGGQYALPSNQWELELEHWFKFTLADVQRAILDQAIGPVYPDARRFHSPPSSAVERAICDNQKVRSDSFTSFNVLGLVLIVSIGGFIMILSALLPWATRRILGHRRPFTSLEWIANDTLQLQRLAHEALGAGDWEGACDDYPRTRKGDLLATLNIKNQKHPVLESPHKVVMLEEEEEEDSTIDTVQESLLSLEIPRSSLELSQRFMSASC